MRTRKLTTISVILMAVLSMQLAASGTTYYVATTGSDTDPGTASQPWRSIQHAVDWAYPGDTVIVRDGTYSGAQIGFSGLPGIPITLKAENRGKVKLNAIAPGWTRHNSILELEDWNSGIPISYWVVDGFEVDGQSMYGCIDIRGYVPGDPASECVPAVGITVQYCHAHHAEYVDESKVPHARTGIFDGSHSNALYAYNETDHNTEHGMYHSNSSDGGVIIGNVSHDNAGCGFHNNGDVSLGLPGIVTNVIYEKNIAYGNGAGIGSFHGGGAAINLAAESRSLFKNNLMFNNHAGGMTFYQGEGAQASSDDRVFNNTIVMPVDGRFAVLLGDGATNDEFYNNILYNANPRKGSYTLSSPVQPGFRSDNNIVCNDRFNIDGETSDPLATIGIAQWRALANVDNEDGLRVYDPNSIPVAISSLTSIFNNPGANDYNLKPGSPAIDSGVLLSEVEDDITGGVRPAGAGYDIGAYEYGAMPKPVAAAPTFMPPAGTYSLPLYVALYCSTGGAEIRFTLDGSDPDEASQLYTEPIYVQTNTIIKMKAFLKGYMPSPEVTGMYIIGNVRTLSLIPGFDNYADWVDTWLRSDTPDTPQYDENVFGLQTLVPDRQLYYFQLYKWWIPDSATILSAQFQVYVTDVKFAGMNPPAIAAYKLLKSFSHQEATYNSARFGEPWGQPGLEPGVDYAVDEIGHSDFLYPGMQGPATIDITRAMQDWYATRDDGADSTNHGLMLMLTGEGSISTYSSKFGGFETVPQVSATYIDSPLVLYAQPPRLTPAGGTYVGSVDVEMQSSSRPTEIRYTLDGSEPTDTSTLYEDAIHLTSTTTVKARTFWLLGQTEIGIPSETVAQTYTFATKLEPPQFTPGPASVNRGLEIFMTSPIGGTEIHYTINGPAPTASSPLYTAPIIITVTSTVRAICTAPGFINSDVAVGLYRIDSRAPSVTSVATVPDVVLSTIDTRITVTAAASDFGLGNSRIVAAECYTDPATSPGGGFAMTPDDGIFDSPLEHFTGTLDCSTWEAGTTVVVFVWAEDEAGNWSQPASIDVSVVSAIPPATIRDLLVTPSKDYVLYYMSQEQLQFSSEIQTQPATNLIDGNHATTWQTVPTTDADASQWVILDISNPAAPGPVTLGGVALIPGPTVALFPTRLTISVSLDGSDWHNEVAWADGLKVRPRQRYLWEFEPTQARYVKISGPGMFMRGKGQYCWQIADVEAVKSVSASDVTVTWTAPTDDLYSGGACALYDLQYAKVESTATSMNFETATKIDGLPTPAAPGTQESFVTSLQPVGRIFMAIKSRDYPGNWSAISNLAAAFVGRWRVLSEPLEEEPSATRPANFKFSIGNGIKGAVLAASGSHGFPAGPASAAIAGQHSVRLPLKPGTVAWTPKTGQWRRIKSVASPDEAPPYHQRVFWRIEGKSVIYRTVTTVFGPLQAIYFDTGTITGLKVNNVEQDPAPISAAPDRKPTFSWEAVNTSGMSKFFIDVSTDRTMPLSDRTKTTVLGGAGIKSVSFHTATVTEWSRMRRLAAGSGGTLYWRVRATDKDNALECTSAVATIILSDQM